MKTLSFFLSVLLFSCNTSEPKSNLNTKSENKTDSSANSESSKEENPDPTSAENEFDMVYDGKIDEKYPVVYYLSQNKSNHITGKYAYKNNGQFISLEGESKNDTLYLTEKNSKGKITGKHVLHFDDYLSMSGKWSKSDGNGELNILLSKDFPFFVKGKNDSNGFIKEKKREPLKTETATTTYSVLYNLNGVFTEAEYETSNDGFESVQYTCTNLYTGEPLRFEDVFKPEFTDEIALLSYKKSMEECPEQYENADPDPKNADSDYAHLIAVINGEFHFYTGCDRRSGFFLGTRTVSFTYEELAKYLYENH